MINTLALKAARIKRGLKQEDLARIVGCSTAAYSKKENRKISFTVEEAGTVKRALGLSDDDVLEIFFAG